MNLAEVLTLLLQFFVSIVLLDYSDIYVPLVLILINVDIIEGLQQLDIVLGLIVFLLICCTDWTFLGTFQVIIATINH